MNHLYLTILKSFLEPNKKLRRFGTAYGVSGYDIATTPPEEIEERVRYCLGRQIGNFVGGHVRERQLGEPEVEHCEDGTKIFRQELVLMTIDDYQSLVGAIRHIHQSEFEV